MQLVIDIPDRIYNILQNKTLNIIDSGIAEKAIKNGTPLPKHHGRLIDADELKKHKYHDNNRFENAVAVAQIDWADTIIEADKESEVEE